MTGPGPLRYTAIDIETDTSNGGGLDPTRTHITAVALAFDDGPVEVYQGDERSILSRVDARLRDRSGILLGWNSACFDLPAVIVRADVLGLELALEHRRDPQILCKYAGVPGLGEPVHARWGGTVHVDLAPLFEKIAEMRNISWGLKPVARSFGLEPVEVDRSAMHELSDEELTRYVGSDATVTLELARTLRPQLIARAVVPL